LELFLSGRERLWSGSEDDLRGCGEFGNEVQRKESRGDLVSCGLWKVFRVSKLFEQFSTSFQRKLLKILEQRPGIIQTLKKISAF
jgi:hypothetical protein